MLKNKGFTLVEVLISMVILAVGIMAVATMLSSSLKMIQESQEATESSIFISSLASILNNSDPATLSEDQFSNLTYNGKPVVVTFHKTQSSQTLVRVNVILETRGGQSRTYSIYITRK